MQESDLVRAEEAQRILNSPLFDAAFTETRAAILEALASLDNLRDERARDLHAMAKSLERVRRCLEMHVSTGKIAAKEIEARKRLMPWRT